MKPRNELHIGLNDGGRFVVDNSALASYYGCSTQAWLRYLQGYTGQEASAALKAGSACHAAREQYLKTNDVHAALAAFDAHYQAWAQLNTIADDRLGWANVRAIVQEYVSALEPLPDGHYKGSVLAYPDKTTIEIADLLPLDEADNIWFAFRLDGLAEYQTGCAVEEFKTTGTINAIWKNKWKLSSQVTGYLWAAQQISTKPVLGAFVQGLELSLLPSDPTRRCSKHSMKYSECRLLHAKWETVGLLVRPQQLIEGWYVDALDAARKMRQLLLDAPTVDSAPLVAQEGAFNNTCQWCQFIGMCETGRQPHLIAANYKVERWSPFADE